MTKEEKILEIFKNKEILQHVVKMATSVNSYNFVASTSGYDRLTNEEFELLKGFYENGTDK